VYALTSPELALSTRVALLSRSNLALNFCSVPPLESFHFSQRRAVFEIGWKEFGQYLELRVHIEPE
jgi:hypothetical protein